MLAIYIQGIEGLRGERPFTPQPNDGQMGGGGALKKEGAERYYVSPSSFNQSVTIPEQSRAVHLQVHLYITVEHLS